MKLNCWNFYNFDLEADDMPGILWLSQFFESLEPELAPIFEGLIRVEYDEIYQPVPTVREFLSDPTEYRVKKITFSGLQNFFWVYHYAKIIEAYTLAKAGFYKREMPPDSGDREVYEAVKRFFDEH
jgi:hypothetical protein